MSRISFSGSFYLIPLQFRQQSLLYSSGREQRILTMKDPWKCVNVSFVSSSEVPLLSMPHKDDVSLGISLNSAALSATLYAALYAT